MADQNKVLVITSWAPPMIGGPRSFYNLISQFSPDSYVILTGYSILQSEGTSKEDWLPGKYIFYDYQGEVDRTVSLKRQTHIAAGKLSWQQKIVAFLRSVPFLYSFFYAFLVIGKLVAMTWLGVRSVKQDDCTVILGLSDHGPALISSYLVARLTGKPYCIYLYDIYRGNDFAWPDRLLAWLFERTIFTQAQTVIVNNEGTEQYYRAIYGETMKISVIHNSVFPEVYEQKRRRYEPKKPYTILFTGRVYWAQEQSVMNLLKAMDMLTDLPVQLDLYVPNPEKNLKKAVLGKKNVHLLVAPQSEMPRIQSGATLLYLPLAWHTKSPGIIKTATPGKFTDYLAVGRPILVHAPDYAYISQKVKTDKAGLVVDVDDPELLAKTIRIFLDDPSLGRQMIENSLKVFQRDHDARKNVKKLKQLLFLS